MDAMGVDELKMMNDVHRLEQKRSTQRVLDEVDTMEKERRELRKSYTSAHLPVNLFVHAK
jgi:hypothetical protein